MFPPFHAPLTHTPRPPARPPAALASFPASSNQHRTLLLLRAFAGVSWLSFPAVQAASWLPAPVRPSPAAQEAAFALADVLTKAVFAACARFVDAARAAAAVAAARRLAAGQEADTASLLLRARAAARHRLALALRGPLAAIQGALCFSFLLLFFPFLSFFSFSLFSFSVVSLPFLSFLSLFSY